MWQMSLFDIPSLFNECIQEILSCRPILLFKNYIPLFIVWLLQRKFKKIKNNQNTSSIELFLTLISAKICEHRNMNSELLD